MKKNIMFICMLVIVLLSCLVGCVLSENQNTGVVSGKFTIIYFVDDEEISFEVEQNRFYEMPTIPTKYGYSFGGLYADKDFNNQLIKSNGKSNDIYQEGRDIVGYIQWIPEVFKIRYNYIYGDNDPKKGDNIGQSETFDIKYGDSLFEFNNYLVKGYHLVGWYDATNVQVGDSSSIVLPGYEVFDNTKYLIDESTNTVDLYGKFETNEYNVRFMDNSQNVLLELQNVAHGTAIIDLIEDDSICYVQEGYVTKWKEFGDCVDVVERDLVLYPAEYERIITLDVDNRVNLSCIHAKPNEIISLPYAESNIYGKIIGWKLGDSIIKDKMTMSDSDVTLKAIWENVDITFKMGNDVESKMIIKNNTYLPNFMHDSFCTEKGCYYAWQDELGNPIEYITEDSIVYAVEEFMPCIKFITNEKNGYMHVSSIRVPIGQTVELAYPSFRDGRAREWSVVSWQNENGVIIKRVTGSAENMLTTLYANWTKYNTYRRSYEVKAYDDEGKNPYDTISIPNMFDNYSVNQLIKLGYRKIYLRGHFDMREVDDGYQEFYVTADTGRNKVWYGQSEIQHGGQGCNTRFDTYYFEVEFSLTDMPSNNIYLMYGAHGNWGDTWIHKNMEIELKVY